LTERRQAELTVTQLNEELRHRVAELEQVNRELEAFSHSVSHDLRAPLRAIDGFSRILLATHAAALPAQAQHYLHVVRENAQQMGQLIDDLLRFARLGRQPLNKQPVAPADLVRQVVAAAMEECGERDVGIDIGDLPVCDADPSLLRQVFTNLIDNALKYTRKRPNAHIEIGARPDPDNPAHTVYYVRDNGVGFDMRYVEKLFGVFQRLHRSEDYEGTGVGLATVQRIIHRHGGKIWADAFPDEGATFSFTLASGDVNEQRAA
jgi:light-regulated signal transduction histidine kinase (bacteriophytochrome)